jgi:hypothetical protein
MICLLAFADSFSLRPITVLRVQTPRRVDTKREHDLSFSKIVMRSSTCR